MVLCATWTVVCDDFLNVWEYNLLFIFEVACNLVVVIVVELVYKFLAYAVKPFNKGVYALVYCGEAYGGVVAVRCTKVCRNAFDIVLVKNNSLLSKNLIDFFIEDICAEVRVLDDNADERNRT